MDRASITKLGLLSKGAAGYAMNPKTTNENEPQTFLSLPMILLGSAALLGAVGVTVVGCWLLWVLITASDRVDIDAWSWFKAGVVTLFGLGLITQALVLLLGARYKESAVRARRRAEQKAERRSNTCGIVNCRECQAEVSADAFACPYCGAAEFRPPPPPDGGGRRA